MKVAVLSAVPTCGKSVFMEILGGVYSRSQGRNTALFSTGNISDISEMVTCFNKNAALDNPHIIKAMIDNAQEGTDSLLNYGEQAGDEHVYIFNILNAAMSYEESKEFLINSIKKIPADLSLIEISGDLNSDLNRDVLALCDCSFILTDQSIKGARLLATTVESMPACKAKRNRGIVLSNFDGNICSDKAFASRVGLKTQNLFKFPSSTVAAKMAFNGELDQIIYKILVGDHEVVNFRRPCQDLMEYLFDSDKRKIIREIGRWYK